MIEVGLAFLVFLAPFVLLALLTSALGGFTGLSAGRWRRRPSLGSPRTGVRADARAPVLASDLERDEAVQVISHAVGEGRLPLEEAERRIGAALESRHRHDLAQLVGDLPGPVQPTSSPAPRRVLLVAAVVSILAALAVQAAAGLWELWPVAVATCAVWGGRPRR